MVGLREMSLHDLLGLHAEAIDAVRKDAVHVRRAVLEFADDDAMFRAVVGRAAHDDGLSGRVLWDSVVEQPASGASRTKTTTVGAGHRMNTSEVKAASRI